MRAAFLFLVLLAGPKTELAFDDDDLSIAPIAQEEARTPAQIIRRLVREHAAALKACGGGDERSKVMLEFEVQRDGRLRRVKAQGADRKAAACVVSETLKWRAPARNEVRVVYPLLLPAGDTL